MAELNDWYRDFTSTPSGAIILFVAIFVSRVLLDRWDARQQQKRARKRKGDVSG